MDKRMELDLQEIIGKTINTVIWIGNNMSIKLEKGMSFNIPTHRAFWRITDDTGILLTSEDFFVKTTSEYNYEYVPISETELDRFKESIGDSFEMSDLYQFLDEVFDERIDKLSHLLNKQTVVYAEEKERGDFKLTFSSGMTLECFASSDYGDNHYSHLYVLISRR